jgi:DNA-binding NarL/FixJ family response regulator
MHVTPADGDRQGVRSATSPAPEPPVDLPTTILIADGRHLVTEAVRAELDAHDDLHVVATASDGGRAVQDAERLAPDVAILDLKLPNGDGIRATKLIRERCETSVVIVADAADEAVLVEAVTAGATGFVSHDSPIEALADAARTVGRGEVAIEPRMLRGLLANLVRRRAEQGVAVRAVSGLTRREKEILSMLADGASNDRIAERLVISPQTVRTHVQNLLRKLDLHSRVEAAAFVHANGIDEELEVVSL